MRKLLALILCLAICALFLTTGYGKGVLRRIGRPFFRIVDSFNRSARIQYDHAKSYTAGEAELRERVENLDVHWAIGSVNIEFHSDDTVRLSETSSRDITDDLRLRWWLDGTTLRVRFAKSETRVPGENAKALTITLPEGMRLKDVALQSDSGSLTLPEMEADSITLENDSGRIVSDASFTTLTAAVDSGSILIRQAGGADSVALTADSGTIDARLEDVKQITAASDSGRVELTQTGSADRVALTTDSGTIDAELKDVKEIAAASGSGSIKLTAAEAARAELIADSGNIQVHMDAFDDLAIRTDSGRVIASLPTEPGFGGEIDTDSGRIECQLTLEQDGNTYRCGDGSGRISIHTDSGRIRLE